MGSLHLILLVLLAVVAWLAVRLVRSPVWKQRQLRKASLMAARGDIEGMIRYLDRNRNRKSVACPLSNALIYFLIRAGRFDEAEAAILEAIENGDSSGTAIAQLGYVSGGRGEKGAAEEYYRRAIAKDESLKPTLASNIAALLIESGERLDEAEALLREALEAREGIARSGIHVNLALLHMKREQPREALVQALTGYELMPGADFTRVSRAQALAVAARAYRSLGDGEESAKMAAKALKLLEGLPGTGQLASELAHMSGSGN